MREKERIENAQRADTKKVLTLPNLLSFFRIALIPVIVTLYFHNQYVWSFVLLLLSGVTDVVDGWIARTFHMVSDFGKAIDPVADKLTQITVLLCLMLPDYWWMVAILACKEVSIGILTLIALRRTHSVYSAGWYGKLCTVVIYLSMFVLVLWQNPNPTFVLVDAIVCSVLIVLAFSLYLVRYTAILRGASRKGADA